MRRPPLPPTAPPRPARSAYALCLGAKERVDAMRQALDRVGIGGLVAGTASEAEWCVQQASVVVSHVEAIDASLHPAFDLRSVSRLPLVVCVDGPLSDEDIEALRLRGAACVVEEPSDSERLAAALAPFEGAKGWFRSTGGRMLVPDVIQMVGAVPGDRAEITVTVPGAPALAVRDWREQRLVELDCGWSGRIYVEDGAVIHAETPGFEGAAAIGRMMKLSRPDVYVSKVFLSPRERRGGGRIDEVIRAGAQSVASSTRADLDARKARPTNPDQTKADPVSARPESAGNQPESKEESDMASLDPMMKDIPGARGIAVGDLNGEVAAMTGTIDAELSCAVAVACIPELTELASLFGASTVQAWSVSQGQTSIYSVLPNENQLLIAVCAPSKSPGSVLKKVRAAIRVVR